MPACEMYLERISASLDGALSDAERADLDAHLASCSSCRALWKDLTALQGGCAGWDEASPPEGFADRVAAAAAAERAPGKAFFFRRYRSLLATAAIAALVLLAVRTGGFSALTGARSGAPAADGKEREVLAAEAPANNGEPDAAVGNAAGSAAEDHTPAPRPDESANDGTQRSADGEKTVTGEVRSAEIGQEMTFGASLYASSPPGECETALCGGTLTLPDLPEGEWAWVLVLTGEEQAWPVDVEPVAAAQDDSVRYFSAGADDRAVLETAFADRGCVPYASETTVSGAEKGLICLLAE